MGTKLWKFTNIRVIRFRFRRCRDLIRESEMFVKDKSKIASRGVGVLKGVLCILVSRCLFVTNEQKFCSRRWQLSMKKRYAKVHLVRE